MKKSVLLATDNSRNAGYALDYLEKARTVIQDLGVEVLHVRPQISGFLVQEAKTSFAARQDLDLIETRQKTASAELLAGLKQELENRGFPGETVQTVSKPYGRGVSAEILTHALDKHLDAIVAGRRGLSGIQAFYMGSVSSNLIQHGKVTPVWIVGDRVPLDRILFAVDGSENSLRALDHLAFMLKGARGFQLTLLHVRPRLRDFCEVDFSGEERESVGARLRKASAVCIDRFYETAKGILADAGLLEKDYDVLVRDVLMNVGSTIAEEAAKGNFDTIVMGSRGLKGQIFTGSTTQYVLNQVTDRAVWIVP